MSPSPPFVDRRTDTLNLPQIIAEAIPLAKLIGLVVAVAAVPFSLVYAVFGQSLLGVLFTVLSQFVLAVGSGVVLMYVVARAIDLSDA